MVILMIGFQILRLFCVAYGICAGRNFIHQVYLIDAWSMAEMLWQRIHEILIYLKIYDIICLATIASIILSSDLMCIM